MTMDARVTRMKKFLQKIFQVTPAAGGGTQDANYAVPERTSPTAWRSHAYRAAEAKKGGQPCGHPPLFTYCAKNYIIPPSGIAGAAGAGSGMSTIPHSVVKNIPATDAAFSRATRLTLVGSMTPASNMFTYSPVRAL